MYDFIKICVDKYSAVSRMSHENSHREAALMGQRL